MSEDKQDNKQTDDTVMEQVTEDRPAKKQGSHLGSLLLLAVLIGAGVAAWYYQSMWLPQAQQWWARLIPAQQEFEPMAAPHPHAEAVAQAKSEGQSSGYVLSAITDEKLTEKMAKAPGKAAPVNSLATDSVPVDSVTGLSSSDKVMDEEALHAGLAETITPAPAVVNEATMAETMQMQAKAPAPAVVGELKAILTQARQAFWARDLVKAEELYRTLIEREPTATDAWGELGNIYYGQAKWQQAAEAYAEAAIQLLEQGQYSQAMFLHYLVRGLDRGQAARIDAKTRAMQVTPQG